jgi:hypothetical protein
MATKGMRTGMRAVYQVAAELVARGYIVSPTSRSAFGADLLVTNESCTRAFSVQVKSNGGPASFWLLGEKAGHLSAPSHVYVFVNFDESSDGHGYYVVPSRVVRRRMVSVTAKTGSRWHQINKVEILKYRNAWKSFGRTGMKTT